MKMGDKYLKIVEWSEEDQCYIALSGIYIFRKLTNHKDAKFEIRIRGTIPYSPIPTPQICERRELIYYEMD